MSLHPEPALLGACLVIVGIAALIDFRTRTIPNLLTLGGLVFGLVAHGAIGFVDGGAHGLLQAVFRAFVSALLCCGVPLLSYIRREMGGGDVKLFAAIGAMVGLNIGFTTLVFTFALTLFVLGPWVALRTGAVRTKLLNLRAKLRGESVAPVPAPARLRIALAPSIFVALCVAVLRTGVLHWA